MQGHRRALLLGDVLRDFAHRLWHFEDEQLQWARIGGLVKFVWSDRCRIFLESRVWSLQPQRHPPMWQRFVQTALLGDATTRPPPRTIDVARLSAFSPAEWQYYPPRISSPFLPCTAALDPPSQHRLCGRALSRWAYQVCCDHIFGSQGSQSLGLLPLLKSIQKPCHIQKFAGQTIGVDAYGWLHRGTTSCAVQLALGQHTTKYTTTTFYACH